MSSNTMSEQHKTYLDQLQSTSGQNQSILKVLDGIVDIGMRQGEMRRILAQDSELSRALDDIKARQQATAEPILDPSPSLASPQSAPPPPFMSKPVASEAIPASSQD